MNENKYQSIENSNSYANEAIVNKYLKGNNSLVDIKNELLSNNTNFRTSQILFTVFTINSSFIKVGYFVIISFRSFEFSFEYSFYTNAINAIYFSIFRYYHLLTIIFALYLTFVGLEKDRSLSLIVNLFDCFYETASF